MGAGPFARNGIRPTVLNISAATRTEAVKAVIAYLAENGCLDGIDWEHLAEAARETWARGITEVFQEATRETSKEAVAELAEWEALALLIRCRKCGADEEEPCRDLRPNVIRHNKHPHQERMDDMEAS